VKNRITLALIALLTISLSIPVFVSAQQQQRQSQTASDPATTTRPNGTPARRNTMRPPRVISEAASGVEQDFAEALTIIQENYIDGNKLD
jgi:hypothetical protein